MANSRPADISTLPDDDLSDDSEPGLTIVDLSAADDNEQPGSTMTTTASTMSLLDDSSNASEAVESLLMLGMGDSWSRGDVLSSSSSAVTTTTSSTVAATASSLCRRFSSGSEMSSYYQKMRERNNEASKRCRMKRRLKAVSLEGHLDLLSTTNEVLKNRLARMERLSEVFREAIRGIQANGCLCSNAIEMIKRVNAESKDCFNLTTMSILLTSKSQREANPELSLLPSSSDDDLSAEVSLAGSPSPVIFQLSGPVPGIPVGPGSIQFPVVTAPSAAPMPLLSTGAKPKTVLDILNDTIIQSLGSSPAVPPVKTELPVPSLKNSIKVEPMTTLTTKPVILSVPRATTFQRPKVEIVLESIKKEKQESCCIAADVSGVSCVGDLVDVDDLKSMINTITGKPCLINSGSVAPERVVILSRLGIPFWKEAETSMWLCEGHRKNIIETSDQVCVICGAERATKMDSPQSITFLITQSMSKQNHFQNGKILPVGRLVCGLCKHNHLRGVDTTSSQILMPKMNGVALSIDSEPPKLSARHTVASVKPSTAARKTGSSHDLDSHHLPSVKIRPSPPCFSTAKSTNKVQVIIQPVQKDLPRPQPSIDPSSNKIIRLNEALKDLNPDYNPIGFSITSVKSCSPTTLQEAVKATETAISTLMSIIAPGQEQFLWESIKPILDDRMSSKQQKGSAA